VTHLATTDWRMGAPFFLCAALQAGALILAVNHFRRISA
jgi:DHA1 family tetracycline resistance protein-like MFS transporter